MSAPLKTDLELYATAGERKAAIALVDRALEAGLAISVDNGGEGFEIFKSREREAILATLGQTGDDVITLHDGDARLGFVRLVYGNDPDGSELFADWTSTARVEAIVGELA